MDLRNNMEFKMSSTFIPNISKSEVLKIVEVNDKSVVFQMNNSQCKGVFPLESFQYWIRKSSLIPYDEHEQKSS